jgi:Putative zinc-finger
MNQSSAFPSPPEPSALCTAYAPLLPLLHSDGLPPDEARSVDEHVAGCAWCQAKLAEYDALYVALRRQFGPDAADLVSRVPTVSEIAARSVRPSAPRPSRVTAPPGSLTRSPSRLRKLLPFEAVAALLLVALFGALLLGQKGFLFGGSPTLDAQAQAYVAVLHAYYLPVLDALGTENLQCIAGYDSAPTGDKKAHMTGCTQVETAVVTASRNLLDQLMASTPPPRWQGADMLLKHWASSLINAYDDRIQAIETHDTGQFSHLVDTEIDPALNQSCAPIQQINAELPANSQFPLSASGNCGT